MKRLIRYDWPLHFLLFITNWLPDNVMFIRFRGTLARPFFKKCGKHLGIGRNVTFYNPSQIELGDWVYIAYGCWFSASGGISVGNEVLFGPYVVLATSNHTKQDGSFRFGPPTLGKITVGEGSWIGGNVMITKGCTIGAGSVVAGNSMVNKDVDPHTAVGGIPAKFIKNT